MTEEEDPALMTRTAERADVSALLRSAAEAAADKKAESVEILDLANFSGITDYFLICHGNTPRQVDAIVEAIRRRLRKEGARPDHVEGERESEWVLMDYLDFVIHVFTRDRREFYALERLWSDAPRLQVAVPDR